MKNIYTQSDLNAARRSPTSLFWRQALGQLGEEYVANLLKQQGWLVIERNWHAGRYAEIDIVACDRQRTLVFIEVKTRIKTSETLGFDNSGFDKLDKKKIQKLLGCARIYMAQYKLRATQRNQGCRFDAFVLYYPPFGHNDLLSAISKAKAIKPEVQHIKSFCHNDF